MWLYNPEDSGIVPTDAWGHSLLSWWNMGYIHRAFSCYVVWGSTPVSVVWFSGRFVKYPTKCFILKWFIRVFNVVHINMLHTTVPSILTWFINVINVHINWVHTEQQLNGDHFVLYLGTSSIRPKGAVQATRWGVIGGLLRHGTFKCRTVIVVLPSTHKLLSKLTCINCQALPYSDGVF